MTTPSNLRLFNIRPTCMCLIYINAKVFRNGIFPGAEAGNFAAYEIHMLISSRHSQRIPHILVQPSFLQMRFQKMQLNHKGKRPGTHLLYLQGDIYRPERKTYVSGRHLRISLHDELVPCWITDRYAKEVGCSYAKCVLLSKGKSMTIKSHLQNSRRFTQVRYCSYFCRTICENATRT